MKRALKEPLLHFLLLGAVIFAAYGLVAERTGGEPERIVITQEQIDSMAAGYERTWQHPPSPEELEKLIRNRVEDEVYYREALALGLDKDDVIIRRRLRQKLKFVTDDIAAEVVPTDDELSAYLQSHSDAFHVAQQVTFRQVYLSPEKRGENLARDVAQLLARLNNEGGKAAAATLGDTLMLDHELVALSGSDVERLFGETFAAKLGELAPGRWQGPIESSYGVHLVFVSERTEGRLPALADVRAAISREWQNARRTEANQKRYEAMLERYVVTIERPQPAGGKQALAVAK